MRDSGSRDPGSNPGGATICLYSSSRIFSRAGANERGILLLVGGVILIAVVVGYYVVSSSVSANRQMISSERPSVTLTATPAGSGNYVVLCHASSVGEITEMNIADGSSTRKACYPNARSADCQYIGSVSSPSALSCTVTDEFGHVVTAHVS